ncbi:MAG: hypothetical protein KGS48_04455 [Bacteroidetes bacterium]|nr:hypothetical protein [Bacteroidota bacterium]
MKRRTFVRNATLGALGVGLQPSRVLAAGNARTYVWDWMHHLKDLAQTKRRAQASCHSASFLLLVTKLNSYFEARGYAPVSGAGYFFAGIQENICFFPLQLRHSRAGVTDLLVPMLVLNAEGEWSHALTLTGYQLEALHHAALKLGNQALPIADYLLPTSLKCADQTKVPHFTTKMGFLEIETRIENNLTKTRISVFAGNKIILTDTFVSRHCLTSSPNFVPQY